MTLPLTIEHIRKFVKENSDATLISTEYKNNRTKLKFMCGCGNEFEARFDNFSLQDGSRMCKNCWVHKKYQCIPKPEHEVYEFIKNNSTAAYVSGYKNAHTKMNLKCECGNLFQTTMLNFKLGKTKCNVCRKRDVHNKYYEKDVKRIIKDESNCVYVGGFNKTSQPFEIMCECGNVFSVLLSNFRAGKKRCNTCTDKVSNGERNVEEWLKQHKIEYEFQKRFVGCKDRRTLPFDFYLPSMNIVIEFDGEQHYREHSFFQKRAGLERTKRRDEIKNDYCKKHGIKMIRISYKQINDTGELLSKYVNTEVSV
jgi:very-short-patch-repair endonuclease